MVAISVSSNINTSKKTKKRNRKVKNVPNKRIKISDNSLEANNDVHIKPKWTNKTRVLVFSSRGISFQHRHLMQDIRNMLPHSKSETKMEKKESLFVINEMCEMKNTSKCIFFEAKKKMDLYMWFSNTPIGPSAKFLVENVHTMLELKMTGNCLKGSRPILSFDKKFDEESHWKLLKELFIQIFAVPNYHPKSKPFIDHVLSFSIADQRIWIRNYQIIEENAELVEIGPRITLNPIKIFKGSFSGETLFQNPKFVTPNTVRSMVKNEQKYRYIDRTNAKKSREVRRPENVHPSDPIDDIFE